MSKHQDWLREQARKHALWDEGRANALQAMHDLCVWIVCQGFTSFDDRLSAECRAGFEHGYYRGVVSKSRRA